MPGAVLAAAVVGGEVHADGPPAQPEGVELRLAAAHEVIPLQATLNLLYTENRMKRSGLQENDVAG